MYETILLKALRLIAVLFSTLFSTLGFALLWGPDRGIGLNLMLIASISLSGLLISEAIKNRNDGKR
jgi:hypothetical protein